MEELLQGLIELEDGAEELSLGEYRRRRAELVERARAILAARAAAEEGPPCSEDG